MINLYCCGGTGANIGKKIKNPNVQTYYVDSSTANLKGIDDSIIFLVPDQEGAGKNRSITYKNFKNVAEEVLIKFKPSDRLNIVLSSLSGGSGSIINPLISKELIDSGANTIVIVIDSKSSVIELNNCVKTLKTFKGVSDQTGKSVSMLYVPNTSRKEADNDCLYFIELMSLLTNTGLTEEFDVTDLHNFINFDKVTDNSPDVSVINLSVNEVVTPSKNTSIVSTILLTKEAGTDIHPVTPEYLATCVVTDKAFKNEDIRIDNVLGQLAIIIDELESEIKEHSDNKRINKFKQVEVDSNDDGVVL